MRQSDGAKTAASSGEEIYRRYVELVYLKPYFAIPLFLALFILLLYLLGKFIAIGVGGYFANMIESGIRRLPVVRNVYSAAKQISDFLFSEREFEFTRIVAVEHPRKGIWSVGFVTGEGLPEVRESVGDPLVTVLIPYSPLPITGCTIIVRKSDCIDLDITFDQACEYIVSCGVVGAGEKPKRLPGDARSGYRRRCWNRGRVQLLARLYQFYIHPSSFLLPLHASSPWNSRQCIGPMASRLGGGATARARRGSRTGAHHHQRRPAARFAGRVRRSRRFHQGNSTGIDRESHRCRRA